jgi:hypothetical protein
MKKATKARWQDRAIITHDDDGWWAEYAVGWCSSLDPQCHTEHEDTKAEVVTLVRAAIPCRCCTECISASDAAKAGR